MSNRSKIAKSRWKRFRICCVCLLAVLLLAGCSLIPDRSRETMPQEEIVRISIENITLSGKNTVLEEIEQQINKITIPAVGCQVEIVDCPIAEHESLLKKIRAGITQVDLVQTGLTTSLSTLVPSGLLLPLDDLLEEEGNTLLEKARRLFPATTLDGQIYAVPANLYSGRAEGIGYNAAVAEAYDLTVPEPVTLEDLTRIGRQLKEENSGIFLTTQGDGNLTAFPSFYDTETFGGDFAYGVILGETEESDNTKVLEALELSNDLENPGESEILKDPEKQKASAAPSLQIVNAYATPQYRDYCHTLKTWREEGLMPGDSLISGRNGQDMFNQGEIFFQYSSVSPGTQVMVKRKKLDFEELFVANTGNRLLTELAQEFAWGITSSCEHPDKAMALLNLLYTDAELSNLMQFGRENIEYTRIGEDTIRIIPEEEGGTGYSTYFSDFGDTALQFRYETDTAVSIEDIKEHAAQAQIRPTFGYVFQTDTVANEIVNVQKVTEEYRPILETGMADDVDLLLEEFLDRLNEAGMETIIEENQRQLNAWLSSAE